MPPTASRQEIRHAYAQKMLEYHPDKVGHLGERLRELAAKEAVRINQAYEVLKDKDKKREYDASLGFSS